MSSFWNFLFGIILVILWIIAGVYITQASTILSSYSNRDSYLSQASSLTFWGLLQLGV